MENVEVLKTLTAPYEKKGILRAAEHTERLKVAASVGKAAGLKQADFLVSVLNWMERGELAAAIHRASNDDRKAEQEKQRRENFEALKAAGADLRNPYEKAGLGKAPFAFIGVWSTPSDSLAEHNPRAYNAALAAKPSCCHFHCDLCGFPLNHHYIIKSSDNKYFSVGCDCLSKQGMDEKDVAEAMAEKRRIARETRKANKAIKELEELQRQREANGGLTDKELKAKEQEEKENAECLEIIARGLMPFGKMRNKPFSDFDDDYAEYWMNRFGDSDHPVYSAIHSALSSAFGHLANLPTPNGGFYGEIKQRDVIRATSIASFGFDGYYGYTYIEKLVTDSGELIVYKGSARQDFEKGRVYEFKATIKAHEVYKREGYDDENQTIVQRLANVSEIA